MYESAEGTMVVGRSCVAGALPEVAEVEAVDVSESLLPSVVLCDPVSVG